MPTLLLEWFYLAVKILVCIVCVGVKCVYICVCNLAWPDRFFPFFFVVAAKRVWCNSTSRLVLATIQILEMLIGEDGE